MAKTLEEINAKIKSGEAVVFTAEEFIEYSQEHGVKSAAAKVDVVTTGTFGTMCSSGALLNVGHTKPRMKISKAWLNGVPAYAGLAAVDLYIGVTEPREDDPLNRIHPGEFRYGGGHVIEDLVKGQDVLLKAEAYGTDCYPKRDLLTLVNLRDLNEALLLNPRNAYQNYNVAVNLSEKTIYTYMGTLRPKAGNATFSSAGELSPLLKDPYYRTIGVGSRIFLGGAEGYVIWHGTQHNPGTERTEEGVPMGGSGTLAVIGDLKQMNPRYVRGASYLGYGCSLTLGLGVPIPVLDEDIAASCAVTNDQIFAPVVDYGLAYPNFEGGVLGHVSYADLRRGEIEVGGKKVASFPLSSLSMAREVAEELKQRILAGSFAVTQPVAPLPGPETGYKFSPLKLKPVGAEEEL